MATAERLKLPKRKFKEVCVKHVKEINIQSKWRESLWSPCCKPTCLQTERGGKVTWQWNGTAYRTV